MRLTNVLLPLALLLGCTPGDADTDTAEDTGPDPDVFTVESSTVSLPSGTVAFNADIWYRLESRDGEVVVEGVTGADGTATFEVDWDHAPYALIGLDEGVPFADVGFTEENASFAHQMQTWDETDETITVSGTASPRVEDSDLNVYPQRCGSTGYSGGTEDYEISVPRGEAFSLVVVEDSYAYHSGSSWSAANPVYSWSLVEHEGSETDLALDLDLSDTIEPETASLDLTQPLTEGIDNIFGWVAVFTESTGTWGWSARGTTTSAQGQWDSGTAHVEAEWLKPDAGDTLWTRTHMIGLQEGEMLFSFCWRQGSPADLGTPELLPIPSPRGHVDLDEAVDLDVPKGAMAALIFEDGSEEWAGTLRWVAGTEELWIPAGFAERLPGHRLEAKPYFLDADYVTAPYTYDRCYAYGLARSVQ